MLSILISILLSHTSIVFSSLESRYIGHHGLKVCDNEIVRDIPGNFSAVFNASTKYLESVKNYFDSPRPPFDGRWKYEILKMYVSQVPQCEHFRAFAEKQFDETKYFCYNKNMPNKCNLYSLGSNDQWAFEEAFYKDTSCLIETFDCSCNVTIPTAIRDRTRFHPYCITGVKYQSSSMHKTLQEINELLGVDSGPNFWKMDIEGFEWAVLKSLIHNATHDAKVENALPLQIYAEFHLDREDVDGQYVVHRNGGGHTGDRLRHFLDDMFFKGGYMLMYYRFTVQTRNTDMLFTKVLCHDRADDGHAKQ